MVENIHFNTTLAVTLLLSAPVFAQAPEPDQREDLVFHDYLDADGKLTGGVTRMLVADPESVNEVLPAASETVLGAMPEGEAAFFGGGPNVQNRIDWVFVGDGYQESELGAYANHVASLTEEFFSQEPFRTYASYYNVHRVDVVSNDSGVDNAPFGVIKDTALNMGYWCGGVERRLCVDLERAFAYAANAPDADVICALANNAKYGGVGYMQSNVATASARHQNAGELVLHEMGHAHGDLADEYFFNDSTTHGPWEESWRNVSHLTAAEMAASGTKWAAWLGTNVAAYAGLVAAYQGAAHYQFGLYRPTANSKMRDLGRPFNLPSIEGILLEIYQVVDPVETSSPVNEIHTEETVLFVQPMQPLGHDLSVRWSVDDVPLAFEGTELDLAGLDLSEGWHLVRAVVSDETEWVRDELARASWMTQTLQFVVHSVGSASLASYCSAAPNSTGGGARLEGAGSTSLSANDLDLLVSGLPRSVPGIVNVGGLLTSEPFGDGILCTQPIGTLPAFVSDAAGTARIPVTTSDLPGGLPVPGSTRYLQAVYRDPLAGLTGFNVSDGLRVTFVP